MAFKIPEFLEEKSIQAIHNEMLKNLPEDMNKSPGGFEWDITYPTAYVTAEMAQFVLPQLLMQIWPQFATGEYLDYHAQNRRMKRKEAQAATGKLAVKGEKGTKIPYGSRFSTVSKNSDIAIEFISTKNYEIWDDSVEIEIQAAKKGSAGNVPAGSISVVLSEGLRGITSVTNIEDTVGGFEEESDDELKGRIISFDQSPGGSFIGNKSDYERWALEVTGTGMVTVIPAQDDSGLITLVLTDANGEPASEDICIDVYHHIMGESVYDDNRLAPISGVKLSVIPPKTLDIKISATVTKKQGFDLTEIKTSFAELVKQYLSTAVQECVIKASKIGAILLSVEGVSDFKDLAINEQQGNIEIQSDKLPITREDMIILSEGVV